MDFEEYMRREQEYRAEMGRKMPPEFIASVAGNILETVLDWLKANEAPSQVTDLIETLVIFERAVPRLKNGSLNEFDARFIYEELPTILQAIAELGGVFQGGGTESTPREPIAWRQSGNDFAGVEWSKN